MNQHERDLEIASDERSKVPRFVIGLAAVLILTAVVTPLTVHWWTTRECNRIVETRIDNRAMWISHATNTSDPELIEKLNETLPELECTGGGHPTPVNAP